MIVCLRIEPHTRLAGLKPGSGGRVPPRDPGVTVRTPLPRPEPEVAVRPPLLGLKPGATRPHHDNWMVTPGFSPGLWTGKTRPEHGFNRARPHSPDELETVEAPNGRTRFRITPPMDNSSFIIPHSSSCFRASRRRIPRAGDHAQCKGSSSWSPKRDPS